MQFLRGVDGRPTLTPLLLGAAPALVVGCLLLHLAVASDALLAAQGLSAAAMLVLAVAARVWCHAASRRRLVCLALAGLVLLLLPLVGARRPARWLELGTFAVYVAPLVLPSLLLVAVAAARWGGRWPHAVALGLGTSVLLVACQPDRAQVLALAVASACVLARLPVAGRWRWLAVLPHAGTVAVAVPQPDGLLPVAHVEWVFALAFERTPWLGLAAVGAALVLMGTTAVVLVRWRGEAVAVPVYYAVLYLASVLGWTPAPLLGFGCGPVLGYGLMVGVGAALVATADRATLPGCSNDAGP